MRGHVDTPGASFRRTRPPYSAQKPALAKNSGFVFEHVALNLDIADDQRPIRRASDDLEGIQRLCWNRMWPTNGKT